GFEQRERVLELLGLDLLGPQLERLYLAQGIGLEARAGQIDALHRGRSSADRARSTSRCTSPCSRSATWLARPSIRSGSPTAITAGVRGRSATAATCSTKLASVNSQPAG